MTPKTKSDNSLNPNSDECQPGYRDGDEDGDYLGSLIKWSAIVLIVLILIIIPIIFKFGSLFYKSIG